jgi:DNA-binding winged helix-turn-helix (wHTH) protein/tetratricopeptide (TPR) repeat protein
MSFEKVPNFLANLFQAEMSGDNLSSYRFKSFLLDVAERQLTSDDESVPLTPKAFDVLVYLVTNGGHLVHKDELMQAVWPDSYVDEVNLPRTIHTLRRALGEDNNGNKFIETVATKGYRFVADVAKIDSESLSTDDPNREGAQGLDDGWLYEPEDEKAGETGSFTTQSVNRITPSHLLLISLAVVVAASLVSFFAFRWNNQRSLPGGRPVSIAILPLKKTDNENQDSVYRLGVADTLISRLTAVKGLNVRSLSSTWNYLDADKDPIAVGREQQVDFVLSSNYQIVDGKIRVNSQLTNAETGNIDATFMSDRVVGGVFETEDAIAADLGGLLLKRFGSSAVNTAQNRGTANEEAYRLYLEGSFLVDKRKISEASKGLELFDKAIALDPNFARAYAGKAYVYRTFAVLEAEGHTAAEDFAKSKEAVETALRLDPNSAEAYTMLAEMTWTYERKFDEAEADLRRAVEIDPRSAFVRRFYALYLTEMGRFEEALEQIKTGIELEPSSVFGQRILGQVLYCARRYDESIVQLSRVREMDPNFRAGTGMIWRAYLLKGDTENAYNEFRAILKRNKASDKVVAKFDAAFAANGFTGVFRLSGECLESKKEIGLPYLDLEEVYAQLGDTDKAITQMEKEIDIKELRTASFRLDPILDPIRSNPRYQELTNKVNPK